jgi:hypothetical protein
MTAAQAVIQRARPVAAAAAAAAAAAVVVGALILKYMFDWCAGVWRWAPASNDAGKRMGRREYYRQGCHFILLLLLLLLCPGVSVNTSGFLRTCLGYRAAVAAAA